MLIVLVVGFFGLTCLGGVGYGVYWVYNRAKETVNAVKEGFEKSNWRVTQPNYNGLRVGTNTRMEVDRTLGDGKVATTDDLKLAFGTDQKKIEEWTPKVEQHRAIIWRNNDDYILAAFHPGADAAARLQAKEWRPKSAGYASDGELDDTKFLEKYPPGKKPGDPTKPPGKDEDPPAGPLTEVNAEDLAQEFKSNEGDATSKYKDTWLQVEGKVLDVTTGPPTDDGAETVTIKLSGVKSPTGNFAVWCSVRTEESKNAWDTARGQMIKIKGKCTGGGTLQTYVGLKFCRIDSKGNDPALSATAASLIAEFAKSSDTANDKYKDQEVVITNARFMSLTDGNDLVTFTGTAKGGAPIKLQANFSFGQRKKLEQLKPNQPVKFRAKAGLLFGTDPNKYVSFYEAYLVP